MSYKNFKLTEEIDQYINEKNRTAVISVLTSICYRDKNFSTGEFDAALEYTTDKKAYQKLWEKLKEKPLLYKTRVQQKDPSLGGDDYARCIAHLQLNFCQERIDDLEQLGRYLFPVQEKKAEPQPKPQPKVVAGNPPKASSRNPLLLLAAGVAGVAAIVAAVLILKKLF